MISFFRKKKRIEPRQVQVLNVDALTMTVAKWRSIPELVTAAQKVLSDPNVKAMLGVLRNDAPHNYAMILKGAQPMEYAERVGDIQGYLKCLNNLEAMATPLETHEMPEATFEPIEKE